MTSDLTIRSIQTWNFCPVFRDGPYAMSHVVQESIYGRIVMIQTGSETHGVGELVFRPVIAEESWQDWIRAEPDYLSSLPGEEIDSIRLLARDLQETEPKWSGVAFGLETAFYDILGKRRQMSLTEMLGGNGQPSQMNDYFSISEDQEERIRERIGIAGADRAVIQLKLGIGTPSDDIDQINAALNAMNQYQVLLADANGGWSVRRACDTIRKFHDQRIVWEEPCSTYSDNMEVAKRMGQPLMLDQCVGNVDIAMQAISDKIAGSICIKPVFLGGLDRARKIRDHCVEAGMKMRIDGPWCGDIATAANLHIAAGAPPDLLIASCDLREPLLIEQDLEGAVVTRSSRIAPPTGHGVGIQIDPGLFGEPEAIYR